jgi:hypothetical protein
MPHISFFRVPSCNRGHLVPQNPLRHKKEILSWARIDLDGLHGVLRPLPPPCPVLYERGTAPLYGAPSLEFI